MGLLTVGGGANVHIGVIGVNHHIDNEGNETTCIRVGLGIYAGTGIEVNQSIKWNNNDECKKSNEETWTLGVGVDVSLFGPFKGGFSAAAGPDGASATVSPIGVGAGISGGVEYCYSR